MISCKMFLWVGCQLNWTLLLTISVFVTPFYCHMYFFGDDALHLKHLIRDLLCVSKSLQSKSASCSFGFHLILDLFGVTALFRCQVLLLSWYLVPCILDPVGFNSYNIIQESTKKTLHQEYLILIPFKQFSGCVLFQKQKHQRPKKTYKNLFVMRLFIQCNFLCRSCCCHS